MSTEEKLRQSDLKAVLDRLYEEYIREYRRSPTDFFRNREDPLQFPHRFRSFHDVEATAFLASTFAYGNVRSLCRFVDFLITRLQPSPYRFLKKGPDAVHSLRKQNLYYRFHKADEILALLETLALVYREHGSLYRLFMQYYDNSTIFTTLSAFIRKLRSFTRTSLPFLLPLPEDGSTCKRLNLFLRWMVRRDDIDFGLWKKVSPADLIMPVDTHIGRLAYRLGWITTPSLTWKKAEQITAVLRRFDPLDPTRYDFSLCHESIAGSRLLRSLLLRGKPADRRPASRSRGMEKASRPLY